MKHKVSTPMASIGSELIVDHTEFTEAPSAGDESDCLRAKRCADQAAKGFRGLCRVDTGRGRR